MSKKYVKPMVCFESFELSTSICGSCGGGVNSNGLYGGKPGFADPGSCAWVGTVFGDVIAFLDSNAICVDAHTEDPEGVELYKNDVDGIKYCYNKGTNSSVVMFSS